MISPKKMLTLFLAVAALAFGQSVGAQEAPDAMIKRLSQEVIDAAKTDKDIQAGNPKHVRELVDAKILPHVDFERMTAITAGPAWKQATPNQQKQLTSEFRTLIIHTYSGAIAKIKDQQVTLKPMQTEPGSTDVEVRTEIVQPNGSPVQLDYRLEKASGGWKIYDISIMGVWLVETYKSNFAAEVGKGGIDGLIKSLANKNKIPDGKAAKMS